MVNSIFSDPFKVRKPWFNPNHANPCLYFEKYTVHVICEELKITIICFLHFHFSLGMNLHYFSVHGWFSLK